MTISTNHFVFKKESPKLFFLVGLMGSGKTYWGNIISKNKEIVFLDMDELIEADLGMSVANIFSQFGETFFREKEAALIKQLVTTKHHTIIATGGGTPCFYNNMDLMNKNGITVWLNESADILNHRIKQSKLQRPLVSNLQDAEIQPYLETLLKSRLQVYSKCKYHLTGTEINKTNLLKIINEYV
jgi:shikimate kinase